MVEAVPDLQDMQQVFLVSEEARGIYQQSCCFLGKLQVPAHGLCLHGKTETTIAFTSLS